jgi:hypothetical protein
MGFLDRLLGREKKDEEMPAEPQPMSEGTQPNPGAMTPPPEPGAEGTEPEREQP